MDNEQLKEIATRLYEEGLLSTEMDADSIIETVTEIIKEYMPKK